jgi:hypothetical protein
VSKKKPAKVASSKGAATAVLTKHRCVACEQRILTTELAPVLLMFPAQGRAGMRKQMAFYHKKCR